MSARELIPLVEWARLTGTNERTARTWSDEGVLDGGTLAAEKSRAGWLAGRKGGWWFVVRVPDQEAEADAAVPDGRLRALIREEVAAALEAVAARLRSG